jgi:hypothetical protein
MSKLWCFFGVHDYKILAKGPYVKTWIGSEMRQEGTVYHLQCARCGQLKNKVLV